MKCKEDIISCKIWTALVTPFNDDGQVDYLSLEKIVSKQNQSGNGILLFGSTGESLALSVEEKKKILSFVIGMALNVPIMIGVGGYRLDLQKQWISYCNIHPISAYLLGAPMYAKPGIEGQTYWFSQLLKLSRVPCILYNIPSRSGIKIYPEVVRRLFNHQRFYAIKEAGGSLGSFLDYKTVAPSIDLLSGDDALMSLFCHYGCRGLISVASNVWPRAIRFYVEECFSGNRYESDSLWLPAMKMLFSTSNPVPVKALLYHKKWISSFYVRPPLCSSDLISLDGLIKSDNQVSKWLEAKQNENK